MGAAGTRPWDSAGRGRVDSLRRVPVASRTAVARSRSASSTPSAAPPRRFDRLSFIPSCVAVALYARSVGLGFALDDTVDLLGNRFVTGPLDLPRIFSTEYYGGWGHIASGHYRPLLNLTYALVATLFGLRPAPYHALNVLLFAAVVFLTVRLVGRLAGDRAIGFAAGLLLAVHPIVSESVAAIAGLKELAAAGLSLEALAVHLRGREADWSGVHPRSRAAGVRPGREAASIGDHPRSRGAGVRPWAVMLLSLAALLYKETALAFAAAAVAAEFLSAPAPRLSGGGDAFRRVLATWPFAAAAAVALSLRAAVTGGLFRPTVIYSIDNPLVLLSGGRRLIAALSLIPRYLLLVAWPACLSSDYSDGSFSIPASAADFRVLAGIVLAAGTAAALVLALRRGRRTVAFGLMVFAASYLLVSHLVVPIGTIMAERLFFVPFWGLAVTLAGAAVPLARRVPGKTARSALSAAALLLLAALSFRTFVRVGDWTDNATLVASVARCYPDNLRGCVVRAEAEARAGRRPEAREMLGRALASRPQSSWVQAALGSFELEEGNGAAAERFLRACADGPEPIPGAVVSLALLYLESGRDGDALAASDRALAARPSFPDAATARLVRGEVLFRRGDTSGAEAEFRLALEEQPDEPAARFNLGRILESRGRWEEALAQFTAAEAHAPRERLPEILVARARAEEALGRTDAAGRTSERLRALQ